MLSCCLTHSQVLDTLFEVGYISNDTAESAKAKYEKLHSALVAAMSREKTLLEEAKSLKKDLEVWCIAQDRHTNVARHCITMRCITVLSV